MDLRDLLPGRLLRGAAAWNKAQRGILQEEFIHAHDSLHSERQEVRQIVHIHEYDTVDHDHPGFGPGYGPETL